MEELDQRKFRKMAISCQLNENKFNMSQSEKTFQWQFCWDVEWSISGRHYNVTWANGNLWKRKNCPKNGIIDKRYRWNEGTVPYHTTEKDFSKQSFDVEESQPFYLFNSALDQIQHIRKAMEIVSKVSCIKFVRRKRHKHRDFIRIKSSYPGCFSPVGRQQGEKVLNLEPDIVGEVYFRLYSIVHEFMH